MQKIFRFIILSNEKKYFMREIDMYDTHTFFALHKAIRIACDYDDTQLASFIIFNNKHLKQKELTLIPMDTHNGLYPTQLMNDVKLREIFKYPDYQVLYMFDLFSERGFTVVLKAIMPATHDDLVPRMLHSKGTPPRQIITGEAYIDNLLDAFSSN